MAAKFDIADLERRMRGSLDQLKKELSGLRTGRASAHLLDPVMVTIYGARMPDRAMRDRFDARRQNDLCAGVGQKPSCGCRKRHSRGQPWRQPSD